MRTLTATRAYTGKLLYGRYAYHARTVKITREERLALRRWVKENCEGSHRFLNTSNTLSVYLSEKSDHQRLVDAHGSVMGHIRSPANDQHEALLKQGNHIEVRDKLYYNRYRYRVGFRGAWREATRRELLDDIRTALHDPGKNKQDYQVSGRDCTLYLGQDTDFTMVRLSMGDRIWQTTVAYTFDELNTTD